jgi:sugar phosphate isomerase/epimerase
MIQASDTFGINTYSYTQSMSAAECLRHLAGLGVRAFEVMFYPGHLWITDDAQTLRELRRIIDENGLALTTLNTPNIDLNIAAGTSEMRQHSVGLNSAFVRMAGELQAKALILGPGKANPLFPLPNETLEGYFFEALDTLLPLAETSGVELWIENMSFAFMPDAEGIMSSLGRYGANALKVCYDVANAHFIGEDPVAGLELVKSRLELVHLSDTTRSVYRHDPVGWGDVDFSRIPEALAAVGHDRRPVLEIISGDADADLAKSVEALVKLGF